MGFFCGFLWWLNIGVTTEEFGFSKLKARFCRHLNGYERRFSGPMDLGFFCVVYMVGFCIGYRRKIH